MADIENPATATIAVEEAMEKSSPVKRKSEGGVDSPARKALKKEDDPKPEDIVEIDSPIGEEERNGETEQAPKSGDGEQISAPDAAVEVAAVEDAVPEEKVADSKPAESAAEEIETKAEEVPQVTSEEAAA